MNRTLITRKQASLRTRTLVRPSRNLIRHASIEPLESRQLLSATFSVMALPDNQIGAAQAFNDAGQIAGSNSNGGFVYGNGKVTDFAAPANTDGLTVSAMNASGQVVGYAYLNTTGASPGTEYFVYSGGKLTLLGLYNDTPHIAINNSGTVAGNSITTAGLNRGFIYANGKATDIGTLGGSGTFVTGMNNLGQIVGTSQLSNGQYHVFLYSAGKMADIDPSMTSNDYFGGILINDAGQIAGNDATGGFLYSGGKITRLNPSGGGTFDVQFINAKGDVAGSVTTSTLLQFDVYLYSGGVLKNLGGNFGEDTSALTGFNNSDEIVGYDASSGGVTPAPFLYQNGALQNINYDLSAIAPAPTPPDYAIRPQTLVSLDFLNNNGQIIADDGVGDQFLLAPANPGSISGTLFHDFNADGVQQSTEPALSGWTVYIDVNDTGAFVTGDPTSTTKSAGQYSFSNLAPGPYLIRFEAPTTDWKQSPKSLTLASGQNLTNINFGTLVLYSYSVADLGTLGGATSIATAINNVGQIVGQSDTAKATGHPFLYTESTGKMTDLSSVLGANAVINGINDLGQIVGEIPTGKNDIGGMPETKAFLYSGGKLTILPMLAGTDSDAAIGINDKGQIVGTGVTPPDGLYLMDNIEGFLYSSGKMTGIPQDLGNIGGIAINNSGQIFENSYYPSFKSAGFGADYLYSGGKLLPLPLTTKISTPGPWFGSPVDVALANTVAYYGTMGVGTPIVSPATFFSGAQAVSLSDALPAKSGWNLIAASALDSANDIVGQGFNPKGAAHAFLLKPVLASISGVVFKDTNGDGVKQTGESGLAGWTVYADLNDSGKYVSGDPTATTNASGNYTITGLPAGGFVIRVVPHTGDRQTAPATATATATQTLVAAGQAVAGPSFGEVATGPFGGTPAAFGKIQAENFDLGGQGSGYFDPGNVNRGGLYRPAEGVGIGAIPSADGGGYFVGWTLPGEYLNYTVSVAATGIYTLNFRVASQPKGGTFHLNIDGKNLTGELSVPSTGDWNVYTIVSKTGIKLSAGTHVLQLVIDSSGTGTSAGGNFDWIEAVKTS